MAYIDMNSIHFYQPSRICSVSQNNSVCPPCDNSFSVDGTGQKLLETQHRNQLNTVQGPCEKIDNFALPAPNSEVTIDDQAGNLGMMQVLIIKIIVSELTGVVGLTKTNQNHQNSDDKNDQGFNIESLSSIEELLSSTKWEENSTKANLSPGYMSKPCNQLTLIGDTSILDSRQTKLDHNEAQPNLLNYDESDGVRPKPKSSSIAFNIDSMDESQNASLSGLETGSDPIASISLTDDGGLYCDVEKGPPSFKELEKSVPDTFYELSIPLECHKLPQDEKDTESSYPLRSDESDEQSCDTSMGPSNDLKMKDANDDKHDNDSNSSSGDSSDYSGSSDGSNYNGNNDGSVYNDKSDSSDSSDGSSESNENPIDTTIMKRRRLCLPGQNNSNPTDFFQQRLRSDRHFLTTPPVRRRIDGDALLSEYHHHKSLGSGHYHCSPKPSVNFSSNADETTSTSSVGCQEWPVHGILKGTRIGPEIIYNLEFSLDCFDQPHSITSPFQSTRSRSELEISAKSANGVAVSKKSNRTSPNRKQRTLFTEEEDNLLIHLREEKNMSWKRIEGSFPRRTRGSLAGHYYTKLNPPVSIDKKRRRK
ncbi:MAG: hypothetical protein M1834_009021 [Cirrosporium novae-zelandiae]|nr:MAG: hypothetical protein M1834_009021 [Cirrosporium novae-zelandiae]